MPMTGNVDRVEVITSDQRRRRWSVEEKARIVQETYAPGMSVSLVARQHGVAPNQVFKRRQLYAEGALSAVGCGEEAVAASEYPARSAGSGLAENGCCGHLARSGRQVVIRWIATARMCDAAAGYAARSRSNTPGG